MVSEGDSLDEFVDCDQEKMERFPERTCPAAWGHHDQNSPLASVDWMVVHLEGVSDELIDECFVFAWINL